MNEPIRIRAETLLLALDYLQFLGSFQQAARRENPLENPYGFSTDVSCIDGILRGRCGCPYGIGEIVRKDSIVSPNYLVMGNAFDWERYYRGSIWKAFHRHFLGWNRDVPHLLHAEVDVAPLLASSEKDLDQGVLGINDYKMEAAAFGRLLALLASGVIVEADLMDKGSTLP